MEQKTKQHILHIGQKLYRERNFKIEEYTITKIGTKYFEVAEMPRDKINKETLKRVCPDYMQYEYQLYLTEQEIKDKNELSNLYDKVRKYFSYYTPNGITLEQLRQIAKILELDK